jgi:hypothetical protein
MVIYKLSSAKTNQPVAILSGSDERQVGSKLGDYHVQGVHLGGVELRGTIFLLDVPNAALL